MKRVAVRLVVLATLALLLTACGPRLTQENFNKLDNGMSYAEVVKILGEPQSSEGSGAFGITAGTSIWKDGKHQITVVFLNEKVTSKVFAETVPAPAGN